MEYETEYELVENPVIPPQPPKKYGFAIASLVLGLVSMIFCCTCVQFAAAPTAIVFGTIALVHRHDGTGMSLTGVITAVLSLILTVTMIVCNGDLLRYFLVIEQDYYRVLEEQDEVFPAYEESGTLPSFLLKYTESPYVEFLDSYDSSIYIIMDALNEDYKSGILPRIPTTDSKTESASKSAGASVIFPHKAYNLQ